MITENLPELRIHKLTQEQYDRELEAGRLDENAFYLTPEEELDLSMYALLSDMEGIYETKTNAAITAQNTERLFAKLMPAGIALSSTTDNPIDLNSVDYLKVGNYYCSKDADAKTMTNCPSTSIFLMQVYSPGSEEIDNEETQTYCYRIRKLINRNGAEYTQVCYTGATANEWTYGTWNKSMRTNHIAVSQTIKSGEKIGTVTVDGKATALYAPTAEFTQSLLPSGTAIPGNIDLNSVDYLRPGNYYCSKDVDAKTMTNCPSTSAFLLEVYSPDSTTVGNETTKTYCNRIRKLINRYGAEYTQVCSTGATANEWTYGTWNKVMRTNNFNISPSFTEGESIGTITVDGNTTTLYIPDTYETKADASSKLIEAKEYADTELLEAQRFLSALIPQGTSIDATTEAPVELNSVDYLKVGNYYCSSDAKAKNITNCPSSSAFLMSVFSPTTATVDNEETKTYCYRLRKIINRSGAEYTQVCSTGATANEWTYGTWNKSMRTNHIAVSSSYSEGVKIGSITVDGTSKSLYAPFEYSTTDLTAGSSTLATGNLYIVYE